MKVGLPPPAQLARMRADYAQLGVYAIPQCQDDPERFISIELVDDHRGGPHVAILDAKLFAGRRQPRPQLIELDFDLAELLYLQQTQ